MLHIRCVLFRAGARGANRGCSRCRFLFFYLCNPRLIDVASQYIVVEIRKLFYNLTFFQSTRLSLKIKINQWGPCRVGTVVVLLDPIQRVAGSSPSKSKTCFVVSTHCKRSHCVVRWKKSENLIYIPWRYLTSKRLLNLKIIWSVSVTGQLNEQTNKRFPVDDSYFVNPNWLQWVVTKKHSIWLQGSCLPSPCLVRTDITGCSDCETKHQKIPLHRSAHCRGTKRCGWLQWIVKNTRSVSEDHQFPHLDLHEHWCVCRKTPKKSRGWLVL